MTLDETLRALCEKHGLDTISIGMRIEYGPYATVWWYDADGCKCESGEGLSAEDAVSNAIAAANAARAITPEIPTLEIGEIAA